MRRSYHAGILGGSSHEAWHGDVKTSQQLSVDGDLEEAVEVLAVGEAQEVTAVTPGYWHGEHDGIQQQVHQLLTLHRDYIPRQEVEDNETLSTIGA